MAYSIPGGPSKRTGRILSKAHLHMKAAIDSADIPFVKDVERRLNRNIGRIREAVPQ